MHNPYSSHTPILTVHTLQPLQITCSKFLFQTFGDCIFLIFFHCFLRSCNQTSMVSKQLSFSLSIIVTPGPLYSNFLSAWIMSHNVLHFSDSSTLSTRWLHHVLPVWNPNFWCSFQWKTITTWPYLHFLYSSCATLTHTTTLCVTVSFQVRQVLNHYLQMYFCQVVCFYRVIMGCYH